MRACLCRRHETKHQYGQCATTALPPDSTLLDVTESPYGPADIIPRDATTAYTMMTRCSHDCRTPPGTGEFHHHHHFATVAAKPCVVTLPQTLERDYQPTTRLTYSPSLVRNKMTTMSSNSRQFITAARQDNT